MRTLITALLFLVFQQVSFADPVVSTVVYGGIKSSYTLGNDVVSSKAPVFQGGVTFTSGANYLDLWGSHPMRDAENNPFGKEMDITIGHNGELGSVNMLVAISHYNLYPVGNVDGNDIIDIFGEISAKDTWHSVSPFLKVESLNSSGFNVHNAIVATLGLRKNNNFSNDWSVAQQLQLCHQPEIPNSVGAGTIGYYKASISKQIGKTSVGASYERYQPFGMDAGREPRDVVGVNIAKNL